MVTRPGKILCLGRNFREHAAELGNQVPETPLFFMKPTTSLIGPGEPIALPPQSEEVHFEAELALFVGRRSSWLDPPEAEAAIAAWTVLNDVTARDLQRADKHFTRAKGFDTFCPLSDVRLTTLDWASCRIQCWVNGVLRQDGAMSDLVFSPAVSVAYLSRCMTLEPGDLISLGTPSGVGALHPGDVVEVRLVDHERRTLISLQNPVRARA